MTATHDTYILFALKTLKLFKFLHSTLSLIINIVTPQTVTAKTEVIVQYASHKQFKPYSYPGYAGSLARLQNVKQTLDNQVNRLC